MNYSSLIWVAVILLLCGITTRIGITSYAFSRERRLIKMEIRRALDRGELRYWEKELRALYLSLIPGISRRKARDLVHRRKEK